MTYKRNQIEEAIGRIFQPGAQELSLDLRTRIKRLVEVDRNLGRNPRSRDPVLSTFAFFSQEAPGTGADVQFSEYEAFALLNALRIMHHGWPQSFAVSALRRLRTDLEREHSRVVRLDPQKRLDEKAVAGDLAVDNTDPVFIRVISNP